MDRLEVQGSRLLADLQTLRSFGATGNGVVRPAFSGTDLTARRWLADRMAEAGLTVHWDPIGNLFGLPPGDTPALLIGSHSDTQPEGGWLDGAFGVIAGLEVARASCEQGGPPVAVVAFQDEEGRFGGGVTGTRVWTGEMALADADASHDRDGQQLAPLRATVPELADTEFLPLSRFHALIEPHIEQGPVLDREGLKVGLVEDIVGSINLPLTFLGHQNHAGTTPMPLRRDAFQGLLAFAERLNRRFTELAGPATVWTIGQVALHPNAPSIVPGRARAHLQWRDASAERLQAMESAARSLAAEVAAERKLEAVFEPADYLAPVPMAPHLIDRLQEAAEARATGQWRRMPSGALHDASVLARHLPTAMLFAPSIDGISHSFEEDTEGADLVLVTQVLAEAATRVTA
ncbi:MAG: hydantoinase/carbamoylase family amidase [Pseudomonadota bacterium]